MSASPETTDVMVLCGGRGSRLGPLTSSVAKPLLPIGGAPFLLHVLRRLQEEGFGRFVLSAHYLAEQFRAFAQEHRRALPDIEVVAEPMPLGTGGAVRYAAGAVGSPDFLVINGDSWVSGQRFTPVFAAHERKRRAFTAVAVDAAKVQGGALNKGVWSVNASGGILGFSTESCVTGSWVNAGIYVLNRAMVGEWPEGAFSLEQSFPSLLAGRPCGVFCSTGRLLDIGTPECYQLAQQQIAPAKRLALTSGGRT